MVNMILDMDLEDPAIDETIRDWVKVGKFPYTVKYVEFRY